MRQQLDRIRSKVDPPAICSLVGRNTFLLLLSLAAGLVGIFALPMKVIAGGYTFTRVATTGNELQLLLSQEPQISDIGRALFVAQLPGAIEALVYGDASSLQNVTTWTAAPRIGVNGNALGGEQTNLSGEVTFRGGPGGSTQSIYIWHSGISPQPLYSTTGAFGRTFNFASQPSINDTGKIAFVADGQGLPTAVFVGDRNGVFPTTVLASTGGPLYEGFSNFNQPSITNDGTVFVNGTKNGAAGLYKLTGPGTSVPIAQVGSEFSFVSPHDPNNSNNVAFLARTIGGTNRVYVGNENGITAIASDGGGLKITNPPGFNDLGEVVFRGQVNGGARDLLLTGPNVVTDRLIAAGDTLFGETVTVLYAGIGSINNAGQIAFYAQRRNPATGKINDGIFIATPVPEPSATTLLCIAGAIVGVTRRQLLSKRRGCGGENSSGN